MARHLPNQRTRFLSRLDRLEAHLVTDSDFDNKVKAALTEVWLPFIQDDTPIILDISDIAKPLAKKMDYPATVRDGSTGELVNGYWLVELYVSLSRKNPVPVLQEPFSHEQPNSTGQNPVVLNAVHNIFELTNKRGVLVVDRRVDEASDWLIEKLQNGARLSSTLFEEGEEDGFGKDLLFRAKKKLGAKATKDGFGGQWFWELKEG